MAEREGSRSLAERIREAVLESIEQHAPSEEELQYGRELAAYVLELMQPALDALQSGDHLDCVRHLDAVCWEVTAQGLGDLVRLTAEKAVHAARDTERADLVRGWAHRVRGYVDLVQGDPGKARRRFRQALRYGKRTGDETLTGASWLSVGVSYTHQNDERRARKAYEKALPHARRSDEPWVLAFVADNLAALMGPDEAEKAEGLYEESIRAGESSPRELSPAPALTNLGILRDQQGRHSEAERLFREALRHGGDDDPRGVLLPLQNLAVSLANQRRFSDAVDSYREAIELAQRFGDVFREGQLRIGLAVCLANAEEYDSSYEQFALLAESAGRFGLSDARVATIVRDLGVTAMRQDRPDEAIAHFRDARRRYEALGDKRGAATCLLDDAAATKAHDPEAQVRLIREALELLKGTRHHDLKLDAYGRLVWALFENLRISEARDAFAEERRLLRRLGRTRTLARRSVEMGSLLSNVRLHREAIRELGRSAQLYEQVGDETGFVESRNDLANSLVELGETEEAEQVYLDNLERARRLENRVLQLNALLNLGELCRREDRTDEALRRLREANKLGRALHDLGALALGLNNLGLALERSGDTERALSAFEQSLATAGEAHDVAAVARALSSIGSNAFERGNYAQAREMYERAVERTSEADDKGLQAGMLLNLAAAVHKEQGAEAAEQLIERAINMAQEVLHYDIAFHASSSMTNWFLESKDMEKAGEWSAYALLFGPLLSGEVDRWATWIVGALSTVADARERSEFVESMATNCRRLERESNLGGQLTRGVEAVRSGLT